MSARNTLENKRRRAQERHSKKARPRRGGRTKTDTGLAAIAAMATTALVMSGLLPRPRKPAAAARKAA